MESRNAYLSGAQRPPAYDEAEHRSSADELVTSQSPEMREDNSGLKNGLEADKTLWTGATTTLHRSPYILFLVLLYSSLAALSWAIICVLAYKPVNARTYSFSNRIGFQDQDVYRKNEDVYRAMRVLQALVGLLTIPVTSAACSSAAVAYVQHNKQSFGMSMRQTIALADRGWTDPTTFVRLFSSPRGFRKIGSLFLLLALALNIIGGVIQPLQQIILDTKSIKTPGGVQQKMYNLLDIPDQFRSADETDNQLTVLMTRDALSDSKPTEPVSQFWHGDNFDCATINDTSSDDTQATMVSACGYGATLGRWAWELDPFLAELPSTFTSGLMRQFAPRFNSSAGYEPVDSSLYPRDCSSMDGSYFVRYESGLNDTDSSWYIEVCIPSDQRISPWKDSRARQDFGEELFLNISRSNANPSGSIYRLSINTSAGYFELPSYLNGGLAGPLLPDDPWHYCDEQCQAQGMVFSSDGFIAESAIWDHSDPEQQSAFYYPDSRKRSTADAQEISQLPNKGPLLTIALALFGEGSFIGNRVSYPESIIDAAETLPNGTCTGFAPLHFFLQETTGFTSWQDYDDPGCIISNDTFSEEAVDLQVRTWIRIFDNLDNEKLTAAMNAAAFLATKSWMDNQVRPLSHTLTVEYDLGNETLIPAISFAGIVVVSVMYFIFLGALLAMAGYASFTPRWTHSLDAFTMMRLGAAMGEAKVPLLVNRNPGCVDVLDRTPGWLGDEDENAENGKLALGAASSLRRKRRYACYKGDGETIRRGYQGQAYQLREVSKDGTGA